MFGKSSGKRLLFLYGGKLYKSHRFSSQVQIFPIRKQRFSVAALLSPYFSDSSSDENNKNTIYTSNYLELDTGKVSEILNSLSQNPSLALSFFRELKDYGFAHSVSTYVAIIRILCHWDILRKLDSIWLELIKPDENFGFDISDVLENIIEELEEKGPSSLTLALDGLVKAYASVKMFNEAIDTLFKTKRRGFLPDVKTCNFLMNQLVQCGKSDTCVAIYKQFKMLCLSPNLYTYCIVIKALCNKGDFGEVDVIFKEMDEAGIAPDDYTYATYINGLCSHGMANTGYEMLKFLRGKSIKVHPFAYTAVVRGFVMEKKLNEAESVLVYMDEQGLVPEACCYGELIRGYCHYGNIHKVYSIRTEMESKGVKINCVIVSSILKCLRQIGLACEAVQQFNYYKNLGGFFLDEVLYNDVVHALCQLGRLEEAVMLLDEMKDKRMNMDVFHYTTLMDGYFRQGRVDDALDLFEEIKGKGLKPDIATYNVVARGLARYWSVEEALKLFDHMEEGNDIRPTPVTHNMIIEGLCMGGKVKEAEVFFMNLKGKSLDNIAAMVCGYCGSEDATYTRAAFHLFDMVVAKQGKVLNKNTCLKLLNSLCARGENDRALALFETLLKYDALSINMYGKFIVAFCSCGDMKNARWVFDTVIKAGLAPDVVTYTIMINGYSRVNCLQEAYDLFEKMKKAGIKPDIITYTVLLDGSSKTKRKRDISILGKEMREMGVKPDVVCYTVLIDRYWKSDSLEDAVRIFNEMIDRGLEPDTKAYKALLCGYCSQGDVNGAVTLVQKMPFPNDVAMSAFHHCILKAKKLRMYH